MSETPIFITSKQLAERWNISPRTIERRVWQGEMYIPYIKIANQVRFKMDDVLDFEKKNTHNKK